MNKKVSDYFNNISEKPILSTSIVFVFATIVVLAISYPIYSHDPDQYIKGILMEAHSMLFDLAIIGILLLWLNKSGEKRLRIKRSIDEIDDIRFWKSPEASYKILGNVKRLMRDNVSKIDLNNCYLKNLNLNFANLKGANLNYANLELCSLIDANFGHARLNQVNFENANLNRANLSNSLLSGANLSKIKGIKTNFERACLIKTDLNNSFLIEANFQNADLSGADFTECNLYMPDFRGAKGLVAEQFSRVKTMVKPKMDEELLAKINELYPSILHKNQSMNEMHSNQMSAVRLPDETNLPARSAG